MPAFIKMEREHGSLIAALQKKQNAQAESQPIFTTLKSGLQSLVDRMQAGMSSPSLRLGDPVYAVTRHEGRWRVSTKGAEEFYEAVILATPPHVTRELLRPLHEDFATLLDIEATSAIVIALGFSREQSQRLRIPRGFGYLAPPAKGPVDTQNAQLLACTFMNQKYAHRAPEGTTLLRAFFGGEAARALMNSDEATLVSMARKRLSEALGPLPEPTISVVRRWPLSLPQYVVGHPARMAKLADLLTATPGLHLIGNAYHGVGMPDMVRQGREAARALAVT
jgi:oxygen-dependent protoporphyrinogen oxidase